MTSRGLSVRDRTILKMAGNNATPEEIAAQFPGTPPAKIANEIDRLTRNLNWLTLLQREALLMDSTYQLKADLEEAMKQDFDPKVAAVLLRTLESLMARIDKQRERVASDIERVENAQAREMMKIVETAFFVTLDALQSRFPEDLRDEVEQTFRDKLLSVAREYDRLAEGA